MRYFPAEPPVIICGCHGGGTSFVSKLLRLCNVFMGADAEPILNRKYHESRVFRSQNETFLRPFGDKCGFEEKTVKAFDAALRSPGFIRNQANSVDLGVLSNIFFNSHDRASAWGWKDPRNSLTAPIWRSLFPGAVFVVVTKEPDSGPSNSPSGEWFRRLATDFIRHRYMNPPWLGAYRCAYQVSFERLVTDVEEFNRLLTIAGQSTISTQSHAALLRRAGYEKI